MGSSPCSVLTFSSASAMRAETRRNSSSAMTCRDRACIARLLLGGELPGLAVNGAERAQGKALRAGQRETRHRTVYGASG